MTSASTEPTASPTAQAAQRHLLGLSARLILLGWIAAIVVIAGTGYVLRNHLHQAIQQAFDDRLHERIERVLARLSIGADGTVIYTEPPSGDDFSRIFSGWYWFFGDGDPIQQSRSLWDAQLTELVIEGASARARGPQNEPLRGRIQEAHIAHHRIRLGVFGPAQSIQDDMHRFDRLLWIAAIALLLALVVASTIQVRLGLRPLARLRRALNETDLGERDAVGLGYGPDLDPLARELDAMFVRNASVVKRARSHAADLAHALKKPLAVLVGASLDNAKPVSTQLVQQQVRAMHSLIERHLARAGSGAGERRRIVVRPRLDALLGLMRQLHDQRHLHWSLQVTPDLHWRGEATDLDEMLGNLFDNAGKWARSQVEIHACRDGDALLVCVGDDGPGLSDEQMQHVAQRGRRFDESIEGSGLGLAIVAEIADTYGGTLEFAGASLGGLAVTLRLPG